MVASRCLHPWPPGGDIRVSYNKAHSLDVWMEQCVQRPNKSFSSYSWKKTYISTHFINFTCITTKKKNPLDVPLLKEQNFLFSLSLFPFTETNQIMITGSLEKVKNPLHELNPLSFIQQGLKLSSAWPRCKSQTKAKILKKKKISITEEKRADIQTYIDMMLGMKLLQAATESGYPQSWACLSRHADSLCCLSPCF